MRMSDNDIERIPQNEKRKCRFWTIKWYLFLLCSIVLCQSMITSGYIGSIVSSIESYYGFSTERLGIAFSSYDIIGVFIIPLISSIGSKSNRARIVAFGALIFSIGNILFILPYLINGYHEEIKSNSSNETIDYLCPQNSSKFFEKEIFSNSILNYFLPNFNSNQLIIDQPKWTYYIIILSMITMSIGASPFYTLGITYLTDHLKKNDQPLYTSILYGMVALGPALGFLMGSLFVSKWINIGDETNLSGITKNDPRWIGRWWGGFLISSIFLIIFSLILSTFPSHLREDNSNENENENESNQMRSLCQLSTIKDIFKSIIDLFKNVIYILIILINSIESILVVSFTTYMVKYIESVFNISSSLSSILTGSIVVPAAVCGTILGGYFVRRFHMNIYQCIKFLLICCLISLVGLICLLFIKCQTNLKYQGDNECSQLCHCSQHIYQPVCFQNEITFYSPCYAGCRIVNGTEYSNCTCLKMNEKVTLGLCENVCLLKTCLFLLTLFFVTFFETLMATPQLIIVLRSVKHEYQSFSLGLQNCMMKIIAQIPTPIFFGIIIDNQCLFWSESKFNQNGSCFIYNGNQLPLTLFGTAILIKFISFVFLIILFLITSKRRHLFHSSSQQEQQDLLTNPIS